MAGQVGVASVEEKQGNRVYGAVFDLNMKEIEKLDSYEGYYGEWKANLYVQKETTVTCINDDKNLKVHIYIAIKKNDRVHPFPLQF